MGVADLFVHLESKDAVAGTSGVWERRIPGAFPCDLAACVHKPDNARGFRARFSKDVLEEDLTLPTFRGLEVKQRLVGDGSSAHRLVELRVVNSSYNDVFTSLLEDILGSMEGAASERQAAAVLAARLAIWQRFLERHQPEGLSAEEQSGLYGELSFLREAAAAHTPALAAVGAWAGPDGAPKDFQFESCSVEVKTTTSGQHQRIQIANERQLDDTGLPTLFLKHFSLEASHSAGERLPDAVTAVRQLTAGEPAARQQLEDKLLLAGYLDAHEPLYSQVRYIVRESNLFQVGPGFPRLVEADIPPGVDDVRYSVSVAECKHHAVPADNLLALLRGA